MLDGYEQITLPTGVVEHKYSVGDAIITKRSNGANEIYYLHKDQQGSTTAITNASGNTVQQLMYDPWGKQHVVNTSLLTYTSPATSKGYTGHEMVNDFEVIHMGGRTYNPVLGRFMQADPFIQSPTNLQSYNRYSYVLNNPMSYTDPSGYFFKKLGKLIKDNWRALASIAVGYFTFGLGTGVWSLAGVGNLSFGAAVGWGAAAGAASGFVSTGSLRGALSGAISGAAFGAIGASGLSGVESFAASGLTGGLLSDIQGGKFGHGFVSAGIGAAAGGRFGQNPYAQVIGAAIVGGTISAVTGGKFANGAVGAAFAATLMANWGSDTNQSDAATSSVGEPDFDNEGTPAERATLASKITSGMNDTKFEDYYLGVQTNPDGSVMERKFYDVNEFQDWLKSGSNVTRSFVNGRTRQINHKLLGVTVSVSHVITLYRSAVVGFSGTFYLPGNVSLSGSFSAVEHGHIIFGHELSHRSGIEVGNNAVPHLQSNLNGYNRCLSNGMCGVR
jgi:RHS repeat-associated protein